MSGVQQQELQIEAKLSFYALMREAYDPDGQEGKNPKMLAKQPALRYVKQVRGRDGWYWRHTGHLCGVEQQG